MRTDRRFPASRMHAAALAAALVLAGCGGGVYWSIGGDDEPDVELAAQPEVVRSGETLELQAGASGGVGSVVEVRFYRVDDNGARVLLGSDLDRPFRLTVRAPTVTEPTAVRYQARAWDEWGNRGQSPTVTVTVQP
ncbi:hypothetical protein [Caldimonas thermodepolymerans]|nr:hypothetical protein [Caldimonas thermodepolymerans]UZG44631.1 hypothetical protein ONZ46_01425 [Caldimonas thermodepolymerans]